MAYILTKIIVDETTKEQSKRTSPEKNPAAVALGRLGGLKCGKARAKSKNGSKVWKDTSSINILFKKALTIR